MSVAGFGVHLDLILHNNASFHAGCRKSNYETCFLAQLGITLDDLQPFGLNNNNNSNNENENNMQREVLVWHTKTRNSGTKGGSKGFVV